jgi:hypothetical protein
MEWTLYTPSMARRDVNGHIDRGLKEIVGECGRSIQLMVTEFTLPVRKSR